MGVTEGGVGDLDRGALPQVGSEGLRTKIKKALPRAWGEGLLRSTPVGRLAPGSSWVGAGPWGWLTVTSASQRSSLVPRSAGGVWSAARVAPR